MKIYTKSGDKGETGLIGGLRVSKNHLRIKCIGEIDELNAAIGVLRAQKTPEILKSSKRLAMIVSRSETPYPDGILEQVQNDLFAIGAELADPKNSLKIRPISKKHIAANVIRSGHVNYLAELRLGLLEKCIDELESKLPRLKNFILPGGTPFAAHAHLARAICRRAERKLAALHAVSAQNPELLKYLNRLSDLLFVLAREDVHSKGAKENLWQHPKK